ncbi:MAG: F0F1 ATP synthase subunit A [Bauldia sp.]|nr:MAG: F0F1 ATP synthase subunit A [Bauldia sp.]PWB84195.1 MAG: F0F1 ATP synthase subunit A [Methylocystaceae bacterium]
MNPIEQFELQRIGAPITLFGVDASFTNSALYMLLAASAAILLTIFATSSRAVVPGRGQALAEVLYEFIANTVRQTAGKEGMRFFPFVFTLFTFILMSNLIGLVPYTFSLSSQIVITFAFAAFVITLVVLYGLYRHGLGFLKLFVPHGVPAPVLVVLIPIEIISFLSRPISLSVRLFANILAGHITLAVFGGFVVLLLGAGGWAALAPIPIVAVVAMYALELLVNFLQAFVFAVLTCVYLNDAIHPGH